MELKSLIDLPGKLPTIPKVAQKLIESFGAEDVSIGEIAGLLASDPVLSAKLLRLANSAYFHVSRTIGTVDDALRMLGFVMVRNLVLGNGMTAAFSHTPGIDLTRFWRYSLYSACAGRWLAAKAGSNGDMIFTLGMLHGIGQLQMHAGMPQQMALLDQEMNVLDAGRAALEKNVLGFHFGQVSAELARIWNFPQALIMALQSIPDPLAQESFSEPAGWVHLGAWRARAEILETTDEQVIAGYPAVLARRLGLQSGWVAALAARDPGLELDLMPPLAELSAGLDGMLE